MTQSKVLSLFSVIAVLAGGAALLALPNPKRPLPSTIPASPEFVTTGAAAAVGGAAAQPAPGPDARAAGDRPTLTLLFTSNALGETDPCG